MNRPAIISICLLTALPAFAERYGFERYQTIVDRQMFGKLPEGFDPNKSPSEVQKTSSKEQKELTKEQEKIKSAIRFSMINVNPAGETVVGFTDSLDPKNVRSYYLKVGEGDPWKVESADPTNATMTIVNLQSGLSLDLSLGGSSANGAGASAPAPATAASAAGLPRATGAGRLPLTTDAADAKRPDTLRRMRTFMRKSKAEQAAQAEAQEQAAKEKAQKEAEEKLKQEAEKEQMKQELSAMKEDLRRQREENERKEAERKAEEDRKSAEAQKADEEPSAASETPADSEAQE